MSDFSTALDAAKHGMHIAREDWGPGGGRNRRVFQVRNIRAAMPISSRGLSGSDPIDLPSATVSHIILSPFLVVETSDARFAPYAPSQEDLLAKDWLIGSDMRELDMERAKANMDRSRQSSRMQAMAAAQQQNPYKTPFF